MNINHLISTYGIRHVFHFTDVRNLPSIRVHGLLSWRELQRRGIRPVVPGGNEWSHEADELKDLDAYVHLCFVEEHPMEYRAREEGRMKKTAFLQISAECLRSAEVLFTSDVSNKSGVTPMVIREAASQLDLDVLYRRHDWRDKEIQSRRGAAKKYEILVPNAVPLNFITFPQ